MVVKVYISGISGNKEVKKRQQRVLMILDSKNIKYEVIDITEPGREDDKEFMQNNAKSNGGTVSDPNPRHPLPPQVFNDDDYCGDYDQFDLANEMDTLEQFLKLEDAPQVQPETIVNGSVKDDETGKTQNDAQPDNVAENDQNEVSENSVNNAESHPVEADEKESSVERLKPDESVKEKTPEEEENEDVKKSSKENSPVSDNTHENGGVKSREQSKEKEINSEEQTKDDPSVSLIESERAVAAE